MWRGYNLLMAAVRWLRRQARPDAVTIKIGSAADLVIEVGQ